MSTKALMLGTAQWGWTVGRDDAFRLLDSWLRAGQRAVDTATNYPINKNPADFRAAERILQIYIQARGLSDLQITVKIGALDNMRSPDVNLSPSFIRMMAAEYKRLLGSNLQTIMLHWDNRSDAAAIGESLHALVEVCREEGLRPGLSGLRHPEVYAPLLESLSTSFDIQIKHNILHSDLPRYAPIRRETHRWFVYGINAGGLKLQGGYSAGSALRVRGGNADAGEPILQKIRDNLPQWNTAHVRPPITSFSHVGLIFAALHPHVDGIVLGCSRPHQLEETLDFWRNIEVFDYSDIFSELCRLSASTMPSP